MKKFFLFLGIVALFAACQKTDPVTELMEDPALKGATVGDDKLVGAHYNLNIIGVKYKTTNDISAGNVIFVDLEGVSEIHLVPGEFAVLDKNGTDENGAMFQLPEPGFEPYVTELPYGFDTETDYSVFIRPLGKPLTGAEIVTIADLSAYAWEILDKKEERLWKNIIENYDLLSLTWGEFCPSPVDVRREKGKSPWVNVTAELLSVVYEIVVEYDANPDPEIIQIETVTMHVRIPIFSDLLENEYWKYTNDGLKLLQIRFYPFGTDVTYDDVENGWDEIQ